MRPDTAASNTDPSRATPGSTTTGPAADTAAETDQASSAAPAENPGDPLRARRCFLGGLAVGVLAMSATGMAAATLVASPGEVAARTAAPAPAVLTATARWQVLTDTITVPGVVSAARTIRVTAAAPYAVITVTGMPVRAGDRVRPGQVIAEIDGRPVVLLQGRLPAYRDLHEGDSGPDVYQLQQALGRLGYADFDPVGEFGPSTALALLLLYQNLGYPPPLYQAHPAIARPADELPIPDVYLPRSEVAYIPGQSALVAAVRAQVGTALARGDPVLLLATGHPYVAAAISAQVAGLVRAGLEVKILSAGSRPLARGVLTRISQLPLARGTGGTGQDGTGQGAATTDYPIEVASTRPLPQRLIGETVWLSMAAPVTARPVLAVPVAAIFGSARGLPAHVVRVVAAGRRVRVAIRTGPVADGLVAVQSVRSGALRPGDRVVIGIGARQ